MEFIALYLSPLAMGALALLLWPKPQYERPSRFKELAHILKGKELDK